jgi:proteasome assembly chaperone (PAC2) family protein
MEHVRWETPPTMRFPVVIAAFEGWNDGGDAASLAARWLRDNWAPEVLAEIDAEDFFDFTALRPQARLDQDGERHIVWPTTDISYGDTAGREIVVMLGIEPHLKWRTFCEQVLGVCQEVSARLVLTLGANVAEVPHTRPVPVTGSATDPRMAERYGLQRSRYEGPTGIVGVLHDMLRRNDIPSASVWASVPTYVHAAPSPKAALALIHRIGSILDVRVQPTDLEIASANYERQVSEIVAQDDEMTEYVQRLEERFGEPDVPSGDDLIDEVERFLRDQSGGE